MAVSHSVPAPVDFAAPQAPSSPFARPPRTYLGEVITRLRRNRTAMVGIGFMVGPDPDATDFFSSRSIGAKGGSGQNTTQYESADVDALLAEGAKTVDVEKRKAAYKKMQDMMEEEGNYVFLTHEATAAICRDTVNPALQPDGDEMYDQFTGA